MATETGKDKTDRATEKQSDKLTDRQRGTHMNSKKTHTHTRTHRERQREVEINGERDMWGRGGVGERDRQREDRHRWRDRYIDRPTETNRQKDRGTWCHR